MVPELLATPSNKVAFAHISFVFDGFFRNFGTPLFDQAGFSAVVITPTSSIPFPIFPPSLLFLLLFLPNHFLSCLFVFCYIYLQVIDIPIPIQFCHHFFGVHDCLLQFCAHECLVFFWICGFSDLKAFKLFWVREELWSLPTALNKRRERMRAIKFRKIQQIQVGVHKFR